MANAAGLFITLLALGWLALNCITSHGVVIADLVARAVSANVSAAPVAGVDVRADGRDVVLTGTVASDADKATAESRARQTPGVRTVDNRLVVVPPPTAQAVTTQIEQILLNRKIEFETGNAVLTAGSTPVLQEVLAVLQKAPQLKIQIDGHTDNAGAAAKNRALSQARAEAVVQWLAGQGIARDRLSARGFGPDKPLDTNATAAGRARNRRVELTAQ